MMNKNKHKDKYPKLTSDITSKFELYPNKTSDMNELSAIAALMSQKINIRLKYSVVMNRREE